MVFGLKLGRSRKAATEEAPEDATSKEPVQAKSGGGHSKKLTVNEFIARTKRCREKGLEPTGPELIAYARYLGIDPIANHDLMWIADEALNAPLPPDWTEHHDNTDRVFYYNTRTRESSWTHPLEKTHRDLYKAITEFRGGDLSKEEQVVELMTLRSKCEESEREAQKELQAWSEHVDDQGQKFYYNCHEERSSWTDPRPARCHCLYLQMKQLRVLSKHCGRNAPHSARERESGPAPLASDAPAPSTQSADNREARRSSSERHSHSSSGRRGRQQTPDQMRSTERQTRASPERQRQHSQATDNHRSSVGAAEGAPTVEDGDSSERRRRKKRLDELKDDMVDVGSLAKTAERRHAPTTPGERDRRQAPATPRLKTPKTPRQRTPAGEARETRETRATFGVLPSLPTHNRPLPGTLLNSNGRLPSPPGDGLSTHGRAKVRAGIRLEPLKGGA